MFLSNECVKGLVKGCGGSFVNKKYTIPICTTSFQQIHFPTTISLPMQISAASFVNEELVAPCAAGPPDSDNSNNNDDDNNNNLDNTTNSDLDNYDKT